MDGNGCSIGTHILSYKPERAQTLYKSSLPWGSVKPARLHGKVCLGERDLWLV